MYTNGNGEVITFGSNNLDFFSEKYPQSIIPTIKKEHKYTAYS